MNQSSETTKITRTRKFILELLGDGTFCTVCKNDMMARDFFKFFHGIYLRHPEVNIVGQNLPRDA